MSVVFIVGSEEELSSGEEWCEHLCRLRGSPLHLVVPGVDRKTLAELARRRMSERLDGTDAKILAELVEPAPRAVLKYVRAASCDVLMLVYRDDEAKFQRQLFEESRIPSLWLRPSGPPPASAEEIWSVFCDPNRKRSIAWEKRFGLAPSRTLCETVDLAKEDLAAEARPTIQAAFATAPGGLVVCDLEHAAPGDRLYRAGLALLDPPPDGSIALVHPGDTLLEAMAAKIRHWAESFAPAMEREERIELAQDLQSGSQPNLEFLGLISASAMLASFGLLQNSASVIIGAMLIAPLMTPILGAGLALTQGNRPLFRSATWTISLGFIGALISSMLFGWLYLGFQDRTVSSEMWARCRPSPLDFCVGLVGGIAASYARTRSHLSSALAGAAIAAALVPPIATAGLQLAFWKWDQSEDGIPIIGPLLLVSVNVLTIMIGSSFVLWARGMRIDRSPSTQDRWVLRMFALLTTLVLLILIWTLHPFSGI